MGGMQGALANVSATDLGATAVKAAVERSGVPVDQFDRTMGCVLPAGLGRAHPRARSRQVAEIGSGEPINKVCGSGMQTVIMGAEALATGDVNYIVAGGMESMTNAPYLLKKHRSGARLGHDTTYDHMFLDGLEDAYEEGRAMGTFAQDTANDYQLTREQMDEYSIESLRRANAAIESGAFVDEVVPVTSPPARRRYGRHDDSPARASPTRSRLCAPPSPRTARSPQRLLPRSPTARPRSC